MFIFALLFVPAVAGMSFSLSRKNRMLLDEMLKAPGPRGLCSNVFNVSWLSKPPFINSNGTSYPDGIFYKVLELALNSCCASTVEEEKPFIIRYNIPAAANTSALHQDILDRRAHLILPVQSAGSSYKGLIPYIKILESPGIALIQKNDSQQSDGKNAILWNAIYGCWPIVFLTLLLSFVAGLCVWILETKRNSQEFNSPFDGFWWAFVTMTTLGYGDKTPKSTVARMFSVLWMMIGVTITSILTATLSSALTSVSVETCGCPPGMMRIGVVKDNEIAFQKAIKLGMEVKVFETLDEAHDALVKKHLVDGLLEETLTAMEYLNKNETSLSSIVYLYEEKHGYGLAYHPNTCAEIPKCISNVSEFAKDEVYRGYSDTVNRHFNRIKKFTKHQTTMPKDIQVKAQNVINQRSLAFVGTAISFCGVSLLFCVINVVLECCRSERAQEDKISHQKPPLSWDEKYSEFLVTELVNAPFKHKVSERGKDQDN